MKSLALGMKHNYENTQDFNFITRTLHATRYKKLVALIKKISPSHKTLRVVDVGCGPAKAYEVISGLGIEFTYFGVELRKDFSDIAKARYGENRNFKVVCDSIENVYEVFDSADLIIGLETFEHIPDSLVVKTIEAISKSNFSYLYITVPNEVGPAILVKNLGSFLMGYVRHAEYSWRETIWAATYKLDNVERHGVNHKGFDWRWLAHTLRQNCRIQETTTSPISIIPKFISPSIGFVCYKDVSILDK